VLAVQGYDDEYGTMAQVEAVATQVRGPCEVVRLEACGHSPHRDQPERTLEAIVRFVARCSRPERSA
jgi:pimeloyl-ACP methyl ester carboxylesterase